MLEMIFTWLLTIIATFGIQFGTGPVETPYVEPPQPAPVVVVEPILCPDALLLTVANPELQAATTQAVGRLTDALGCVPFVQEDNGHVVQFFPGWFSDTSDPSGFDWTWVPAGAFPSSHPTLVMVNPRCWERVDGDWSLGIAHELGHILGWADLDGHPYMTCPSITGEYYRSDLVVVCGP